jgi:hypothetical protein
LAGCLQERCVGQVTATLLALALLAALLTTAKARRNLVFCFAARVAGQTAASLFWIGSVFSYGIEVTGDYLQICAAFAWLLASNATLHARGDQPLPMGLRHH